MSLRLAQYLVSILNAGSIFGRTLPGFIGDKIGRFNVMIVMAFFTVIIILGLWIPSYSNAPIIVFALLFGFSSGGAIGLTPAMIAQISNVKDIGVRTGTVFAICSISALTGSPIGGALISQQHGQFLHLQLFSGLTCFGGACLYLAARISLAGWKLKAKI